MTQQADPRFPAVDSSVDAETTAPGTPFEATSPAQPSGWPPTAPAPYAAPSAGYAAPPAGYAAPPAGYAAPPAGYAAPPSPPVGVGPMPQAPLNTLSWLSVVMAFIVSPVAIVLGIIARKQIARTGERGRGLATLGAVLGSVFSLIGIASTIIVLVLASQVSASLDAATSPVPAVTAGSPVAPAPAAVPAPAPAGPTNDDYSTGQAQLMTGFIQVGAAAETMSSDLDKHSGDLNAMQGDFSAYRTAIAQFRTTATTATLSPDVRQKVDADLVPAIDRVLADLDTLSNSSSQSKLTGAADRLQGDSQAMVTAATAAIGG